jgi:NTE family protein
MTRLPGPEVAIALSGGGIRAMAFHLGVLKYLAETRVFDQIQRVSTVSGGSLVMGLILQDNNLAWPGSDYFLSATFPSLRNKLCERSLQWGALRQLAHLKNFRFLLSRANLLSLALQAEWGVRGHLSDLPPTPEWSINGTTAENGKRFRFKRDQVGDYITGYCNPTDFALADALAVSAAFPGAFGPLTLDASRYTWLKRAWNAPIEDSRPVSPGFNRLHLYDGGVYDNLGLEPFFDVGKGVAKHNDTKIIVSDAGAPLEIGFSMISLNPSRFKRVADIMSEQTRALRVRAFSHYLQQKPGRGAYIYINTPISGTTEADSMPLAARFPTTLRRLTIEEFDVIANHGYFVTKQVEQEFGLIAEP